MSQPGDILRAVVGPLGYPITRDTLPPPDTVRWNARRKAELLLAIRADLISLREVVSLYQLSAEEIAGWLALFERHGLDGLKTTRAQTYRQGRARPRLPPTQGHAQPVEISAR
ncbi:DUF1153 domain-containing protein [Phenylobacterium sp.]|uniref:DUF1153 domain-containing protein n=1 Tax=Phenylobacterium sp. TaxID=1871053 RepID=UPI0040369E29